MNEITKTACFFGAALVCVGIALATRSNSVGVSAPEEVGQPIFPEFTDPLKATSLKIVRFDEALARLSEIEAKESNGIWTLPSHSGYPADAENRIRDAATPFIDLETVAVQSDNDGDHALYGVVEPGTDKSAAGDQGVGTLVTIKGDGGKNLVNLIIGKEVKDNPELRYVRRPNQSRVYLAKVNPENLPVRFEDWIEKDLLKLNSWDVDQMVLKDYTFQVSASFSGTVTDYDQKMELTVSDQNGTWLLENLMLGNDGELTPADLGEGKVLNQQRLNEMRDALDTLEIIDVERKPAGLGADLRAEDGVSTDREGFASLMERGFYPVKMPTGTTEMLSQDGEVLVQTSEGVEYVLRFGGVEGVDTDSDEGKLKRYLMVSARVHEAMFPEPELETLPETVEDLKIEDPAVTPDDSPAEAESEAVESEDLETPDNEADNTNPAQSPPEDPASDTEGAADTEATGDPASDQDAGASLDTSTTFVAQQEGSDAELAESREVDAATNETESDAPIAPPTNAESEVAQSADAESDAVAPDDPQKRLQAERERITRENQRKIDERNDKLEKARTKVAELNYRFADWYYVISEDVYKKIHLNQEDVAMTEAEAEAEAAAGQANPGGPGLPLPAGFQ
jgi:hypothetical protein